MDIQTAFAETLAEGRDHLPLAAALSGDETGKSAHVLRQPPRFRRNDEDSRLFMFLQDHEVFDGCFQIIDLARQDMRGTGDGPFVGIKIGVDRMILSDPLVEKIDMIRGRQMAPAR